MKLQFYVPPSFSHVPERGILRSKKTKQVSVDRYNTKAELQKKVKID